jgi:hypothetical protein
MMAHFYAHLQGNRGIVNRCGTKSSGIYAHVRGWDLGIHSEMALSADEHDRSYVAVTGGSNNKAKTYLLYVENDPVLGKVVQLEPWLKELVVRVYEHDPKGPVCIDAAMKED